jgi:hypothetical protein
MTRLYENPGFWRRSLLSVGFLAVAIGWGVWEFWSAAHAPAEAATTGYMFGAVFFFGGLYALYQLTQDWRDLVSTLDLDETTGTMIATVWLLHRPLKLTAAKGELRNWRSYVKVGKRNARMFFLYTDHATYPRPLRFDLRPGVDVSGLRRIAADAIADHDEAGGRSAV